MGSTLKGQKKALDNTIKAPLFLRFMKKGKIAIIIIIIHFLLFRFLSQSNE